MSVKILVVDDEADLELLVIQRFRKKIAKREYEFIFSNNGVDALQKLKADPDIEVILTDINMPEMDGLTLLGLLPQLNRPYKAIVVSAYEDMSNIRSAMNKGAVDFITKPIDFQDLELTLDKTIQQCKSQREVLATKSRLLDIEKELDIARKIQEAMIPEKFEIFQNERFQLFGKVLPAKQIGGDFFDFFALDDRKIAFLIADVSGKSISASLFMAISKTLFRSVATRFTSPAETLKEVDMLLSVDNPNCMFVTAFYAIFDASTGILTYSNAGHAPPYILSNTNELTQIASKMPTIPLGIDRSIAMNPLPPFTQSTIALKSGDSLFLYTDGVTEAMNRQHQLYGEKRLFEILKKCGSKTLKELIDTVIIEVERFAEDIPQSDDIGILCLRYL